jgi:hypothetical protein
MIRGNAMAVLSAIGRLERVLERLIDLPRKVAVEVKPEIDRLLRAQFRAGVDPYGKPWAPLRPATLATGRRPPPLTGFTRELRSGTATVTGGGNRAGLRIKLGAPYGYFHQVSYRNARTGRKVVARKILPDRGMPREWSAALNRAAARIARRAGQ